MTNEDIHEEVGREIRRRREALGWTLEELAARAGMTQNYLGSVENGRRDPSLSTILAAARGLAVRPSELFDDRTGLSAAAREMAVLYEQTPRDVRAAVRAILKLRASARSGAR